MNLIKIFFNWILGWVILAVIVVTVGWIASFFIGDSESKNESTKETTISKDEKLIEIRKTYWENGNVKEETPYKKSYSLGYKKVKTKLIPHGISKEYYENGVLKKEDPYVEGAGTGTMKFYNENAFLGIEAKFVNSKREGKTTYYYSNGSVMDVEYYKDGNLTEAPSSSGNKL